MQGKSHLDLKTYTSLPKDDKGNSLSEGVYNYTDTADEGDDYLCSINYLRYKGDAYVIDVLYSKSKYQS